MDCFYNKIQNKKNYNYIYILWDQISFLLEFWFIFHHILIPIPRYQTDFAISILGRDSFHLEKNHIL